MLRYLRRFPDLVAKLQILPAACIAFEADGDCAIAIKGPGVEPIGFLKHSPTVFHDLYYERMPTAPVLYLVAHTLDDDLNDRPCIAGFDVGDPVELRLVFHLARQTELRVFFVTATLDPLEQHILEWDHTQRERAEALLTEALHDLTLIPPGRYDFQTAFSELRSRLFLRGLK